MRLHEPLDKDQRRIFDIVSKSMCRWYRGPSPDPDYAHGWKMDELARRMNAAIKDEDKRRRRAEAAMAYGLRRIAGIFAPGRAAAGRGRLPQPAEYDPHLAPGATPE